MNVRWKNLTHTKFCSRASQSWEAVSRNRNRRVRRARLNRENRGNPRTQSIGIHSQFTMGLPHAFSHSPDPDAHSGALGLNFCESFRRHSFPPDPEPLHKSCRTRA